MGAAPAFFFYGRFHGENHHFQRPAGSVCAIHARRHGHPQTLRATARRPRSPSPRVAGPVAGQSRRERLLSLGRSGPGVRSGFLETPRARFGGVFLASAQTASQSAVPGASTPRVRRRSEAVDVDHGQLVYPSLKDCPVVMDLHELSPVGRRAPGLRGGGGGTTNPSPLSPRPQSLNPCPFAHPLASKSSFACSMPSRLRWHS